MKKRTFWVGACVGAIASVALALLFAISGAIPMKASGPPGLVDRLGNVMWERSMAWRAPDEKNPYADNDSAARGFEHYRSMCVHCHGAPNVPRADWARGLHPLPPDLASGEVQGRSDGALFYIVRNGVLATGMPAFSADHSDQDVWRIVAFLRRLSGMTEAEERRLEDAVGRYEHAGHDAETHEHRGESELHEH